MYPGIECLGTDMVVVLMKLCFCEVLVYHNYFGIVINIIMISLTMDH